MRPLLRCLLVVGLLAGAALIPASPALANPLLIELRTDFVPYRDFVGVRTRISPVVPGVIAEVDYVPRPADLLELGVRIAEYDVPPAEYLVSIEMIGADGDGLSLRTLLVAMDPVNATSAVVLYSLPAETVEKTAALAVDADGDGEVSGGDILRYTIAITGESGGEFLDG